MKRRRRKQLASPEAVGMVLDRAGEDLRAPNRPPMTRHQWESAVGAPIASRTQPIALEGGVLVVRAATAAWTHELSLLKATLIENIAARGHAVTDIRFRVGAIDPPLRPPAAREQVRRVPAARELPAELAAAIAQVQDDELRTAVAAAARASLAWVSAAPPSARGPRAAETESAPRDRTGAAAGEAAPDTRGAGRDRRR